MTKERHQAYCVGTLSLVLLLTFLPFSIEQNDSDDVLKDYHKQLHAVQSELQKRLHATQPRICGCSYDVYGTRPSENITQCVYSDSDPNELLNCPFHSCGHLKISTSEAYFHTNGNPITDNLSSSLKRDICLTQGLGDIFQTFKIRHKEIGNPTYFGATETGLYFSWPGRPKRRSEAHSHGGRSDPRTAPWWKVASYSQRNVVILLDETESMREPVATTDKRRWQVALEIVTLVLDTLADGDTFQIVVFNRRAHIMAYDLATGNNETVILASPENIQNIKNVLNLMEPGNDPYADIGKALRLSFDLLGHDTGFGKNAENHIVLLSDSRDCAETTLFDCATKEYVNQQRSEFLHDATPVMLDFTQHLLESRNALNSPPVLFSFSLGSGANGVLSQLACKLNGIHIDTEKKIRKGILDPHDIAGNFFLRLTLRASRITKDAVITPVNIEQESDGKSTASLVITAPVFYQRRPQCPSIHFAVVGFKARIPLTGKPGDEFLAHMLEFSSVEKNERLQNSDSEIYSLCQLQVLRETQCVQHVASEDKESKSQCFEFEEHVYLISGAERLSLTAGRQKCQDLGGVMISAREKDERRVMAAIIPPEGTWIDIQLDENDIWRWPNGEEVSAEDNVEQTCPSGVESSFYMDPRSYEENFHCTQTRTRFLPVCKFSSAASPSACSKIIKIVEGPLSGTVEACGLEDCKIDPHLYDSLQADDLVCNIASNGDLNFNDIACCSAREVEDKCRSD